MVAFLPLRNRSTRRSLQRNMRSSSLLEIMPPSSRPPVCLASRGKLAFLSLEQLFNLCCEYCTNDSSTLSASICHDDNCGSRPSYHTAALPSSQASTHDSPLVLDFTPSVQLDLVAALSARSVVPRTPYNSPQRRLDTMIEKRPSQQLLSFLQGGQGGVTSTDSIASNGLLGSLQASLKRREQG